jgi:hypothetical protein
MGENMKKITFLLLAVMALSGATRVSAQETVTASITIPEVLSISVDNNTVSFPAPAEGDYDAAGSATVGASNTTVISTRGNVLHDIEVLADNPTFSFTPSGSDADPGKDAADLEWSSDAGGNWLGLDDVTPGDVLSNLGRGVNDGAATVQYRLQSTLAGDPPGTYTLTFVYSVVAN